MKYQPPGMNWVFHEPEGKPMNQPLQLRNGATRNREELFQLIDDLATSPLEKYHIFFYDIYRKPSEMHRSIGATLIKRKQVKTALILFDSKNTEQSEVWLCEDFCNDIANLLKRQVEFQFITLSEKNFQEVEDSYHGR